MPLIERSALVNHSAEQMFDLVNDIEKYPDYMRGCKSAIIISQTDDEMVGKLTLAQTGIRQTFTTRNTLLRPHSIEMELVEGKFRDFSARWQFQSLHEKACKVSLNMQFEFDFSLVDLAAEQLFKRVANAQIDALVARAKLIYGC
ncbi:MAG: type II toxin-antitoxin system RatA family toxin [Gammaproteobacteria bacterium]|nr:type II toxin-antitoxin system RatA family toxin [Gammaproteobacteria bacterium]